MNSANGKADVRWFGAHGKRSKNTQRFPLRVKHLYFILCHFEFNSLICWHIGHLLRWYIVFDRKSRIRVNGNGRRFLDQNFHLRNRSVIGQCAGLLLEGAHPATISPVRCKLVWSVFSWSFSILFLVMKEHSALKLHNFLNNGIVFYFLKFCEEEYRFPLIPPSPPEAYRNRFFNENGNTENINTGHSFTNGCVGNGDFHPEKALFYSKTDLQFKKILPEWQSSLFTSKSFVNSGIQEWMLETLKRKWMPSFFSIRRDIRARNPLYRF